MTSMLTRRPVAESSSKAVRYTPCAKAEQTDEEDLDEVAITTPCDTRPPSSARGRSPLQAQDEYDAVESTSLTANGPRTLPASAVPFITPSDRTKLIAERLINRSDSPIYSTGHSSVVHSSRSPSKASIFEMVSNKIESVRNGRKKSRASSAVNSDSLGYVNKAHVTDPVTPKIIHKQRKRDIEEKFGKKTRILERCETSTSASDKNGCRWTFVFDPAGRFAYWWSCVISIAFVYNFWVIIYRFAFEEINADNKVIWFCLDYTADFLYVLDIAFHFRTGFLEDGVLQTDGSKLRIHYVNATMFYIDCLCLLPLDFLYLSIGYKSMLRCFRLVKIYRFWAFIDRTERHTNYPNVVRTVTLLHYLFAIYHWNACLMFLVSLHLKNESWLLKTDQSDVLLEYLHSLYWSTLTLTTIGDLPKPSSKGEYVFVIMEFIFGLLLFSTILGHVANIVTGISFARRDFQAKLDSVKTYMTLRRVPLRLQDRVIKWFDYLWLSKKSSDEDKTLGLLPDKLKAEIALHVHLDTLKRVEIFQNTEAGFLCELVLRLRPVLFSPKDYICVKGEVGKEMYIVNRGRLQVVADNGKTVLATLRPGSYFGEISILNMGNAGNRRTASVRSVGYSDLFCLSKNDLWEVLKDYPTARVRLEAIAVKRLEKYKKAPLEKAALARSKSTPGLIESMGKNQTEVIPLNRHNTLPPGGLTPHASSYAGSHCSLHSHPEELGSYDDPQTIDSEGSRSDKDYSSDALRAGASADITHSMTVSSITSYITESSAQKSPQTTEAPRGGINGSPPSPRQASSVHLQPAQYYPTTISRSSPSQSFLPIDHHDGATPSSTVHTDPSPVPFSFEAPQGPTVSTIQAGYPHTQGTKVVTQLAQISPFNSPYLGHSAMPAPPPPPPPPSHHPSLQPLAGHRSTPETSMGLLSAVSSHNSPLSVSPSPYATSSVSPGALNHSSSAGSLAVTSEQSTEALLHEITRLRERLHMLETENASMNLKLSHKQWEVDNRLAEIELHICGTDESEEDDDADDDEDDDDHHADGDDKICVNKESVI